MRTLVSAVNFMLVEITVKNRTTGDAINKPHDKSKWGEEGDKISVARIRPNKKANSPPISFRVESDEV